MQKQLENTSSINDLQIAEKLELLKQFNNNNNNNINNNDINNNNSNNNNDNDDNDDAPFAAPPQLPSPPFPLLAYPSSIDSNESDIEGKNPVQNFLLGRSRRDRLQHERIAVAVGEKAAAAAPKKFKFLKS